jgi:hypothetical protein
MVPIVDDVYQCSRDSLLVCGGVGGFTGALILAFPFAEERLSAIYMLSVSIPLIVLAILAGNWLKRITKAAGLQATPVATVGSLPSSGIENRDDHGE